MHPGTETETDADADAGCKLALRIRTVVRMSVGGRGAQGFVARDAMQF